jgi:lysophospholipase L1-like esterase
MNGRGRSWPRGSTQAAVWWIPRVLFAGSALLLAFAAASGWSSTGLTAALVVFGVCSALFVGRQIVRGRNPGVELVVAGSGLCAAGIGVLIVYAFTKADVLPLLGAVLVLLGVGWLVETWRKSADDDALKWYGLGLLVVAVVAVGVAAVLLLRGTMGIGPSLIVFGIALVLVLPASLNLLAERGMHWVDSLPATDRFPIGRRALFTWVAGGVLAAAVAFCCFLLVNDWLVTAAVVGIAVVLVLATVSDTHADVAVLLAVVALLAAAPLERAPIDDDGSGSGTLVALGDSYMSGEGAGAYYEGTDEASGDQCRRAPSAYAARLVFDQHRFQHLVFLACSGARTYHVIAKADATGGTASQPGEPGTQVDQLVSTLKTHPATGPDLVLVGIGGNDAGFATIGEICLAPGDCSSQRTLFEQNLVAVRRALAATYASIRRAVPGVPVLAIPYPQPFADRQRCDGVALTGSERNFIRGFVDKLDETVRVAAAQAGLLYVADMKDSLAAHGLQLCANGKNSAGINFINLRSVNGLATERFNPSRWLHNSLHPNERGHAAMAETLGRWLDGHAAAVTAARTAGAPGGANSAAGADAVADPEPPCSMTDTGGPSCQEMVRTWEVHRVRDVAWVGVVVVAAIVLLWMAGVVLMSRSRRRRTAPPPSTPQPSGPQPSRPQPSTPQPAASEPAGSR